MIVYLKTKEEIEGFKEAGKIAGLILKKLLDNVDVGITTKELDEIAREECKKNNVVPTFLNYRGFPAAICASVNNTLVHGIPTDIPLKPKDIISIDLGVTLDGFIGDTAYTKSVSNIHNDIIDACRNSLYSAIKKARSGNKLSIISKEVYKCKKSYSIPEEYGGHGIDRYNLHSEPFVPNIPDYYYDLKLRPDMIFAIEPMLINGSSNLRIADNKWDIIAENITAHFEHTILITEDEPLILTRSDNE